MPDNMIKISIGGYIMTTIEIIIGSVLIAASIFLVVAVLMQSGKSRSLSGAIAGGAETFFNKAKSGSSEKKLSVLTTIVSIVFAALVIAAYLLFQ